MLNSYISWTDFPLIFHLACSICHRNRLKAASILNINTIPVSMIPVGFLYHNCTSVGPDLFRIFVILCKADTHAEIAHNWEISSGKASNWTRAFKRLSQTQIHMKYLEIPEIDLWTGKIFFIVSVNCELICELIIKIKFSLRTKTFHPQPSSRIFNLQSEGWISASASWTADSVPAEGTSIRSRW